MSSKEQNAGAQKYPSYHKHQSLNLEQSAEYKDAMDITYNSFTPRFSDACFREGIVKEQLIKKTREEVIAVIKIKDPTEKMLNQQNIDIIEIHFEEHRLKKVEIVRQARQRILQEEKMGQWPKNREELNTTQKTFTKLDNTQSLSAKQNKLLENIQRRQEQEIDKMFEQERILEEVQLANQEKAMKQQQKEYQREEDLRIKRNEAELKRSKLEEERKKKEQRDLKENQERLQQADNKEQQRLIKEKEKEQKTKEENQIKEEEKKQKQLKIQREIEIFQKKQEELIEQKKLQMLEKDIKRQVKMETKIQELSRHAEQERIHQELKLEQVKQINESQMEKKRQNYENQQTQVERKRKDFEVQNEQEKKIKQRESEKKSEQIKVMLNKNLMKEELKITQYNEKVIENEKKRLEVEQEQKVEQEIKIQKYKEKEMKIQEVLQKNDQLAEQTRSILTTKLNNTQVKLEKIEVKKQDDLQLKFTLSLKKDIDTHENLFRQENLNVLKRGLLEDKLAKDEVKRNQLQKDRDNLIKLSSSIRREADEKRQKYILDFELKQKKKDSAMSQSNFHNCK